MSDAAQALQKCPDCGKDCSIRAGSCPHCGAPVQIFPNPMFFRNPANGYIEQISKLSWLWVFLFGFIYFAFKGVWRHTAVMVLVDLIPIALFNPGTAEVAMLFIVVSIVTNWILYPAFAAKVLRNNYLRKGWQPVKS